VHPTIGSLDVQRTGRVSDEACAAAVQPAVMGVADQNSTMHDGASAADVFVDVVGLAT
jgi:hypothetical protein